MISLSQIMHKSPRVAVYNLKIHLVVVTKYRYKVINAPILESPYFGLLDMRLTLAEVLA